MEICCLSERNVILLGPKHSLSYFKFKSLSLPNVWTSKEKSNSFSTPESQNLQILACWTIFPVLKPVHHSRYWGYSSQQTKISCSKILITSYPLGQLIIFSLDENGQTLDLHADVFHLNTIFVVTNQLHALKVQICDSELVCFKETSTLVMGLRAKKSDKR